MADDAADETSGPASETSPDTSGPDPGEPLSAAPPPPGGSVRTPVLWLAFLAPSAVIALGLSFIVKAGTPHADKPPASSAATPPVLAPSAGPAAALIADDSPALEKAAPAEPPFDEEGEGEQPTPGKRAAPKHFATVQLAALGSCSTESVDGLSKQIIEQTRCLEPNAFVPLPKRSNLVLTPHVFGYMERGARDHLVRVLDAHASATMTINSAFRTVAQQYLVWRWSASKICGVQMATRPGESNHEIGVALDVAEAAKWRPALEAEQFHWLGSADRVHFDYKGASAPPRSALDVLAFQKLWNKNHRSDAIPENGQYDPATEQRLKKAPADGFPLAAGCGTARKR